MPAPSVYPAERFASMARNPAIVWAIARGGHDEDEFRSHDGCRWSIRRAVDIRQIDTPAQVALCDVIYVT